MRFWFYLFPHVEGVTEDGYSNNWWKYFCTLDFIEKVKCAETFKEYKEVDRITDLKFKATSYFEKEKEVSLKDSDIASFKVSDENVIVYDKSGKILIKGEGVAKLYCYMDGKFAVYDIEVTKGKNKFNVFVGKQGYKKMAFNDVKEDDWYYEAIKYVSAEGLFSGVSETEFGPNLSMTRGMLVTVLYRLSGTTTTKASNFSDVSSSQYYSAPIAWATEMGIVNGIGDNKFAPDAQVTREQLVTILYRYAEKNNIDVSSERDTSILFYKDFKEISKYAIKGFEWAYGAGIMKGRTESTLDPKGIATRAEVATMMMRFVEANK